MRNFSKAVILALSILFVIYCITGSAGYLTFGVNIKSDIMILYDASDPIVMIGVVSLIVKMATTFPLVSICGRL